MRTGDELLVYIILLVGLVVLHFLGPLYLWFIDWNGIFGRLVDASIVFTFAVIISNRIVGRVHDFKVRKTINNILLLASIVIGVSVMFDFIVSIGVTFGLIGFALTLVFQSPILSFAAWIYIMISKIYQVDDRIRINDLKGDVIDIDPFRTKILEVGGEYLSSDTKSGRIVYFPNSLVLTTPVHNYTKLFRYIWAELQFTLTYDSDMQLAKRLVGRVIRDHLKDSIESISAEFRKGMDKLSFKRQLNEMIITVVPVNSWVELRVSFVVDPRTMSISKSAVVEKVLQEFKKHPNKIRFPKGRSR
jgi:small-conductance mechanosensitive channel